MSRLAPIALFVYKRPDHVQRTIRALQACDGFADSPVFVFCDGTAREHDRGPVQAARQAAKSLLADRATFFESDSNRGLASSVINGVGRLCESFGRVIVVEDDLVVAPGFLAFMNQALERYVKVEHVIHVTGYMFPVPELRDRREALFLPFISSWGWATWAHAWRRFDANALGWDRLEADRALRKRFDLDGSFDYYYMLRLQLAGRIDSWAIRWYWSVFKHDGLSLFPPRSYVQNTGFDGSGTHGSRLARKLASEVDPRLTAAPGLPGEIRVVREDFDAVRRALSRAATSGLSGALRRVWRRLSLPYLTALPRNKDGSQ